MTRRIRRKKKVSRKIIPMPIYTSPDGGETVYEQLPNGEKKLLERSQKAIDQETAYEELEMVGSEAIKLRRKYPTLQKAWDKYRTVWHLINGNE
tara:strand:+ start:1301 stop:1582 length:282 start_codon:yes stop_codon:yes gene_type:complete